ncbi:MAG: hypothetical protein JW957_04920 [Candidatus Omnitrophica bacterium]|nr:hypothetical protein [Candidatus Omnitrophota bacterium]
MKGKNGIYYNRRVLLDTPTGWVYIGTLTGEDEISFFLEDADAFDVSETSISKHEYVRMVKKDGIAPNRKKIAVLKNKVTAITFIEDILEQ